MGGVSLVACPTFVRPEGWEIGPELAFQAVKTGAHQSESLVQVLLSIFAGVPAAQLDTLGEKAAHMQRTCHNIDTFVCNVVLHAGFLINGQLHPLIDRTSQTLVVLAGVLVVGIILGVINVICDGRLAVATCSALGTLEVPSGR